MIDLITNSLLNMPAENYRVASSEWFNNTRNDIHRINKSLTGVLDVIKAERLIEGSCPIRPQTLKAI